MIIHCDGSSDNNGNIGWGMIVQNGSITEIIGSINVLNKSQFHRHETFAFVEAILYAHKQKVSPKDVSFYTDDMATVNGVRYHNVEAWSDHFIVSPSLQTALDDVLCEYPEGTLEIVMQYLEHSHIAWVKGHSGSVLNMRVDHLAKRAMRKQQSKMSIKISGNKRKIVPFLEWLNSLTIKIEKAIIPFLEFFISGAVPCLKMHRQFAEALVMEFHDRANLDYRQMNRVWSYQG